ncbi:MAG: DUF1566 domain-containing protein [Saccharospirillum sp.]|nr:DUF1566 domain-containing protein [Saccharospirillum sp.]
MTSALLHQTPINSFLESIISHRRIALLGLMSLGLVACGGGGGGDEQPQVDSLPAPQNLTSTAGSGEVALGWGSVNTATDYCVYVSQTPDIHPHTAASYDTNLSACLGNTNTSYTVTDLTNRTEYFFVVTASNDSMESVASNEVSATPEAKAVALNDTGITWCAAALSNFHACPVEGYLGQDGEHGRDVDPDLVKIGGGDAGFDFTKLDADGNPLADQGADYATTPWDCVRDNHTGLIWEVKTTDGGLRDKDNTYTWYNSTGINDGGIPGVACPDETNCDTEKFAAAVNGAGLCGAHDWRLPTRLEYLSITHSGRSEPAIDTDWFPNTPPLGLYSTSSTVPSAPSGLWMVYSLDGRVNEVWKGSDLNVRLVRSGE